MIGSARSSKLPANQQVSTQDFYIHSQGYWLGFEPIDKKKAAALAAAMLDACNNDNLLYSQALRGEAWQAYKSSIKAIKKKVHCDCSSLVRLCIRQAFGRELPNFNTDNEPSVLEKSGLFKKAKRIYSVKDCTNGMVLVTPHKGHTAIFISESVNSPRKYKKAVIEQIMRGELGNGKERIDNLKKLGYTMKQIESIQKEVNELLKGWEI